MYLLVKKAVHCIKMNGFLVLLLLLAPGCKYQSKSLLAAERRRIDEAKLVDISLPLGVIAHDISQQSNKTIMLYHTDFPVHVLVDFYRIEMERLGWKLMQEFVTNNQTLLLYETPQKQAVLLIDSTSKQRLVTIFKGKRVS